MKQTTGCVRMEHDSPSECPLYGQHFGAISDRSGPTADGWPAPKLPFSEPNLGGVNKMAHSANPQW